MHDSTSLPACDWTSRARASAFASLSSFLQRSPMETVLDRFGCVRNCQFHAYWLKTFMKSSLPEGVAPPGRSVASISMSSTQKAIPMKAEKLKYAKCLESKRKKNSTSLKNLSCSCSANIGREDWSIR